MPVYLGVISHNTSELEETISGNFSDRFVWADGKIVDFRGEIVESVTSPAHITDQSGSDSEPTPTLGRRRLVKLCDKRSTWTMATVRRMLKIK